MYPAVQDMKKELGDKVVFIVADFSNDQTLVLATYYDVRYVPDFIVLDSAGNVVAREGGAMSKDDLRAMIQLGLPR